MICVPASENCSCVEDARTAFGFPSLLRISQSTRSATCRIDVSPYYGMYKARECLSEICAIFLEIFVLIRYFQSQYWCLPNLETWRSTSLESEVFPKTTPYSVAQSCLPQKAHTATTDQPLSPTALINRDGCTGREGINGVCQQKNWMEGSEGSRSGLLCQAFQLPRTPQPTPKISKAHTSKSNPILQSIHLLDFLEKRYLDVFVGIAVRSNVEMSHSEILTGQSPRAHLAKASTLLLHLLSVSRHVSQW